MIGFNHNKFVNFSIKSITVEELRPIFKSVEK